MKERIFIQKPEKEEGEKGTKERGEKKKE